MHFLTCSSSRGSVEMRSVALIVSGRGQAVLVFEKRFGIYQEGKAVDAQRRMSHFENTPKFDTTWNGSKFYFWERWH